MINNNSKNEEIYNKIELLENKNEITLNELNKKINNNT